MNAVILIACFSPLVVIWIVNESAVWFYAVNDEQKYVREESKNPMDPILQMHMQMLMKRKKVIEISEKIDKSLFEYYSEIGKPVPKVETEKRS